MERERLLESLIKTPNRGLIEQQQRLPNSQERDVRHGVARSLVGWLPGAYGARSPVGTCGGKP